MAVAKRSPSPFFRAARALWRRAANASGGGGIFHPSCVPALCVGAQNPSLIRNKPSRREEPRVLGARERVRAPGNARALWALRLTRSLRNELWPGRVTPPPLGSRNLGAGLNWCASTQPPLIAGRPAPSFVTCGAASGGCMCVRPSFFIQRHVGAKYGSSSG